MLHEPMSIAASQYATPQELNRISAISYMIKYSFSPQGFHRTCSYGFKYFKAHRQKSNAQ